jgi:CubicO group peptidase (beta-lactamase class C family)
VLRSWQAFFFPVLLLVTSCADPQSASGPPALRLESEESREGDLDTTLAARLAEAHMPGLSACVVARGAVAWCKAYGLADVGEGRPVTEDTVFLLASISKTFTATALMQVWETGAFGLDFDVAAAAPFPVRQPMFDVPISYRMLLSHTGSVRDDWATLGELYTLGADPTVTLDQAVSGYFDPEGRYYDASKNFVPAPPGTRFEYANMGFALVGYLVSAWTKTDFAAWTRDHIVRPLGLAHTSWRLDDFPAGALATPYAWDGAGYVPYEQYTFADYPDGGLRTTAPELGRFLAAMTRGGELDGQRILRADTVASMLAVQYPAIAPGQGLCFYHLERGGEDWVGHVGEEHGAATEMFFRPSDGLGFVLLMNGDWGVDRSPIAAISAIEQAIIDFGEDLQR